MATPKIQERVGTDGSTVNRTADRASNGATAIAPPPAAPGSPAWRAVIKALTHYDPTYPYDPAYEYDDDYTTDPDYGVDGVTYLTTEPHKYALAAFKHTVEARRGRCAPREFTVYLSDAVRQDLPPAHAFRNKGHLIPDVAVLPDVFAPDEPLPHACRLEVDPPPLLVLEVLSESTWRTDLEPKRDAYAAMGIAEYWLYDPEGHAPPAYADGVAFWGWRLDTTGSYVPIPRQAGNGEWPVYHSEVLAADIRMLPEETGELHRLQWRDPGRGLWRDPEVDAETRHQREVQEGEARGEARGKLEERIASLHLLLKTKLPGALLAQIETDWRRAERGRTVAEMTEVLFSNADWRSLLFPREPNGNGEDKPPGRVRHGR